MKKNQNEIEKKYQIQNDESQMVSRPMIKYPMANPTKINLIERQGQFFSFIRTIF